MQTQIIGEVLIFLGLLLYNFYLEYSKIPHLEDVIKTQQDLLKDEQQHNLNLADTCSTLNNKNQDLIKKINEVHRENAKLQNELKWYQVRMDIKRKHK